MNGQKPRPIKSGLKSHRIVFEEERPDRWPYMKILREFSTLKQFALFKISADFDWNPRRFHSDTQNMHYIKILAETVNRYSMSLTLVLEMQYPCMQHSIFSSLLPYTSDFCIS